MAMSAHWFYNPFCFNVIFASRQLKNWEQIFCQSSDWAIVMSLAHLIPITTFRDFTAEHFPTTIFFSWIQNCCLSFCGKPVWKESGLQGWGGGGEGKRTLECQLLLNKLETVEKGNLFFTMMWLHLPLECL